MIQCPSTAVPHPVATAQRKASQHSSSQYCTDSPLKSRLPPRHLPSPLQAAYNEISPVLVAPSAGPVPRKSCSMLLCARLPLAPQERAQGTLPEPTFICLWRSCKASTGYLFATSFVLKPILSISRLQSKPCIHVVLALMQGRLSLPQTDGSLGLRVMSVVKRLQHY